MDNQEGTPQNPEKKTKITDHDLNAIEAWGFASTHPLSDTESDTIDALKALFKTDRKRALTPQNVLNGKHTIEEENAIRSSSRYTDGLLVLFGPKFTFGYEHSTQLGELDEDGNPSQLEIEISQSEKPIDYSELTLDPQFEEFYEKPEPTATSVILKFKNAV